MYDLSVKLWVRKIVTKMQQLLVGAPKKSKLTSGESQFEGWARNKNVRVESGKELHPKEPHMIGRGIMGKSANKEHLWVF